MLLIVTAANNKGQQQAEQAMKAAVSRVRAVVQNVRNDDIALALHQYDMDVDRTIAALTERQLCFCCLLRIAQIRIRAL